MASPERGTPRSAASDHTGCPVNAEKPGIMHTEDKMRQAADLLGISAHELSQALRANNIMTGLRQERALFTSQKDHEGFDQDSLINRHFQSIGESHSEIRNPDQAPFGPPLGNVSGASEYQLVQEPESCVTNLGNENDLQRPLLEHFGGQYHWNRDIAGDPIQSNFRAEWKLQENGNYCTGQALTIPVQLPEIEETCEAHGTLIVDQWRSPPAPQDFVLFHPSISTASNERARCSPTEDSHTETEGCAQQLSLPSSTPLSSRTMTQGSGTNSSHTLSNTPNSLSVHQKDDMQKHIRDLADHGPCSNLWVIPQAGRGNRAGVNRGGRKRKRQSPENEPRTHPMSRGPFQDSAKRLETAETRKRGACIRCFMYKVRCEPNPGDHNGACKTCLDVKRSVPRLPCLRHKITDASLFRDQKAPNPFYSKRWMSMEIRNITEWASESRKTIKLTHGFGKAEYTLELREFLPIEGDLLEEVWHDGSIKKVHAIPSYAIADMGKAAQEIDNYVARSVVRFVIGTVGDHDPNFPFLWETYCAALRHANESPREEEKNLLRCALKLWVTSRMTSLPEWICSDEKIGTRVEDRSSPYYGTYPVAPVICAQLEVITFSQLQRPLRKDVLQGLTNMMKANDRRNWFTIYLTLFILLHSCSLTTKRDHEYATQMGMRSQYANPESISAHHIGMMTMLAYFHFGNKGKVPFELVRDPTKIQELASVAELNQDQMDFLRKTAEWIRHKREHVKRVRETRDFGDHYYFLSQLFDDEWSPTATA